MSIQVYEMVTKMVRHHDQDEREQDGSYHWDTVRSVLLKAFARYGAQKFSEDHWIRLIHVGSMNKRVEYCVWITRILCVTFEQFKDTLWYSDRARTDGIHVHSVQLERVYLSPEFVRGKFNLSWSVVDSGWKGKNDKARQTVFFTPLNPFGENPDEKTQY